jgi:hypothetical protein
MRWRWRIFKIALLRRTWLPKHRENGFGCAVVSKRLIARI